MVEKATLQNHAQEKHLRFPFMKEEIGTNLVVCVKNEVGDSTLSDSGVLIYLNVSDPSVNRGRSAGTNIVGRTVYTQSDFD